MEDRIRQDVVNPALATIKSNLDTIHGKIAMVSKVADDLSSAWSSTNAANVKIYVAKMEDDLSKLYTSVARINGNVQTVANAIKDADDVTINGGGAASPSSFNQSSR